MMPCNSSTLVTRLVEAHGVVLGKTRMHELAEGVTSINAYGGPVLNPYNNTMHVGGALFCLVTVIVNLLFYGCSLPGSKLSSS